MTSMNTISSFRKDFLLPNHRTEQYFSYITDPNEDTFSLNKSLRYHLSFTADPDFSEKFLIASINNRCLLPSKRDHFALYKIRHQFLLSCLDFKESETNELQNTLPSILKRLAHNGFPSVNINKIKSTHDYQRLKEKTPDIVVYNGKAVRIFDLSVSTSESEAIAQKTKYERIAELLRKNGCDCQFELIHFRTYMDLSDFDKNKDKTKYKIPEEVILSIMNKLLNSINTVRKTIPEVTRLRKLHNEYMNQISDRVLFDFPGPDLSEDDDDFKIGYDSRDFSLNKSDGRAETIASIKDFLPRNVEQNVINEFKELSDFGLGTASSNHDPHEGIEEISDAILSRGFFAGYNTPCINASDTKFLSATKYIFSEIYNNDPLDDFSPYSRPGETDVQMKNNFDLFWSKQNSEDRSGHLLPMMCTFPLFEYDGEYNTKYDLQAELDSFINSHNEDISNFQVSHEANFLGSKMRTHQDFEISIDQSESCSVFLSNQHYNKKEKVRNKISYLKSTGQMDEHDNFIVRGELQEMNKGFSMNRKTYLDHKEDLKLFLNILSKKTSMNGFVDGYEIDHETINDNFLADNARKLIKDYSSNHSAFLCYTHQVISQEISLNCEKPIKDGLIKFFPTHILGTFGVLLPCGSLLNEKTRVKVAIVYSKSKRRMGESLRLGPDKIEITSNYFITKNLTIDRFKIEHYLRVFDQFLAVCKSLDTTFNKNISRAPRIVKENDELKNDSDDIDDEANDNGVLLSTDAPSIMSLIMCNHKRPETDFLMESRYVIVQSLTNSSISSATFLDRMDQPIRSLTHYLMIERLMDFMKLMNSSNLSEMINIGDLRSNLLDENIDSDYSGASFKCPSCFFRKDSGTSKIIVGFDQIISEMYLGVSFNKNTGNSHQDSIKICKKLLKSEFVFEKSRKKIEMDFQMHSQFLKKIFSKMENFFSVNFRRIDIEDYFLNNFHKGFIYPDKLKSMRLSLMTNHSLKDCEAFISHRDFCDVMNYTYCLLSKKQHVFSSRSLNIFSKMNICHPSNPSGEETFKNCLDRENLIRPLSDYATFKSSVVPRHLENVKFMSATDIRDRHILEKEKLLKKFDESLQKESDLKDLDRSMRSLNRNFSNLRKKGYDSSLITNRKKCFENISKIIKDTNSATNEDLAKEKIKDYKLMVEMFRKNQLGGPREILILTMEGRVLINIVEKVAINLTKLDRREMLTSGSVKEENFFRTTSLKGSAFKDSDVSVDFYTEDKSKWCQNFMPMCFYYCYLPYLQAKNSKYFFYKVLFAHHNKVVYYPDSLLKKIIRLSRMPKLSPERVYFRSEHPNISKLIDNFERSSLPFVKNTSNMMQGVLHYSSTFLHCVSVTMRDYYHDYFKKKISSPDSDLYKNLGDISNKDHLIISSFHEEKLNTLVTSDDSFDCLIYPGPPKNKTYKRLYYHIRSMHNKSLEICKVMSWRSCCMIENPKKSVKSSFGEFNSTFRILNSHGCPIIKFLIRNCDLFDTDSPANFVESAYQASMNFRLVGGSADDSVFTHLLNKEFFNRIFDIDTMKGDEDFESIANFLPYDLGNYPIDSIGLLDFVGPKYFNYRVMYSLKHYVKHGELKPIDEDIDIDSQSGRRKFEHLRNSQYFINLSDLSLGHIKSLMRTYKKVYSLKTRVREMDYVDQTLLLKTTIMSSLRKSHILKRKQSSLPVTKETIMEDFHKDPSMILSKREDSKISLYRSVLSSYTLGAEKSMRVRSPILFFKRYTGSKSGKYMYFSDDTSPSLQNFKDLILPLCKTNDEFTDVYDILEITRELETKENLEFFENFNNYFDERSFFDELIFQDSYDMFEEDFVRTSDVRARKPVKSSIYKNNKELYNDLSTVINCRWHNEIESDESIDSDFQLIKRRFHWIKDSMQSTLDFLNLEDTKENCYTIHNLIKVMCYKRNSKSFKYLSNGGDTVGVADFVRNILTWNTKSYYKLKKPGDKFTSRFNLVSTIKTFVEILTNSFQYIISSEADTRKIDEFLDKINVPVRSDSGNIIVSPSSKTSWQHFYDNFEVILSRINISDQKVRLLNYILVYKTQNENCSVSTRNMRFVQTKWIKEQAYNAGYWSGEFELVIKSLIHSIRIVAPSSDPSRWMIYCSSPDFRKLGPLFERLFDIFPAARNRRVSSHKLIAEYRDNIYEPRFFNRGAKYKKKSILSISERRKAFKSNFGRITSIDVRDGMVYPNGDRLNIVLSDSSDLTILGEYSYELYCSEYYENGLRKQAISLVRRKVDELKLEIERLKRLSNNKNNRFSQRRISELKRNIRNRKISTTVSRNMYSRNKYKVIHDDIKKSSSSNCSILSTTKVMFSISKTFSADVSEMFPEFRLNGLNVPYMFYMGKLNNFSGSLNISVNEFKSLMSMDEHFVELRWSEIQCMIYLNFVVSYEPKYVINGNTVDMMEHFTSDDPRYENLSNFELLKFIMEKNLGVKLSIQPSKNANEKRIVNELTNLLESDLATLSGDVFYPKGSQFRKSLTVRSQMSSYPESETTDRSSYKAKLDLNDLKIEINFRDFFNKEMEADDLIDAPPINEDEDEREESQIADLIIPVRKRVLRTRSEKILNTYYSKRFYQRIFCSCFFNKGLKKTDEKIDVDVSFSNIEYASNNLSNNKMLWYIISEEVENVSRVLKNIGEARFFRKMSFPMPHELNSEKLEEFFNSSKPRLEQRGRFRRRKKLRPIMEENREMPGNFEEVKENNYNNSTKKRRNRLF